MRQNNLIATIWKSFYSQSLYRDVRQNWRFSVVGYLCILVILYTALAASLESSSLVKFFETCAQNIVKQLPTGQIQDGTMSIQQNSPYTVYYQKNDKPKQVFAIFDMNNKTQPGEKGAFSVFHSNGYFYNATQPVHSTVDSYTFHSYPKQGTINFSPAAAQPWLDKIKFYAPVLLFVGAAIGMLIFKLCQPIFYALIALIFGGLVKIHLTYGEAYRLAIVSSTPAFIVITMGKFFISLPHAWGIAFLVEMIYLYFAVYSNRQGTAS